MEFSTYQDVLNLQQTFVQKLQDALGTGAGIDQLPLKADAQLARKRAALEQTQATLTTAESTRGEIVKRWDGDLARYRQTITQLQSEIAALEAAQSAAADAKSSTAPAGAAGSATPQAAAPAAGTSLASGTPETTAPTAAGKKKK